MKRTRGKTMALTAVNGMILGLGGCASGAADAVPTIEIPQRSEPPEEPSAAAPTRVRVERCCKGMNACKGKGMCKTENNDCRGMNDCKGQGGCRSSDCDRR